MKYAFIMGSNSFIVPGDTIVFTENEQTTDFLRVVSVYHDQPSGHGHSSLTVDMDIKDTDGHILQIKANKPVNAADFKITEQPDRLLITKSDGATIIDVHQLDEKSAFKLEHNITAELEALAPDAVIRIRGNFMVGHLHIEVDNEKVFVNGNSYANSTLTGKTNLEFTTEGIVV
ncbi:MAG: hypothetical protein ACXVB0_25290 [Mucilaginibacter sp.]